MRSFQVQRMAVAIALALCIMPATAVAGPIVVEETARLTSPEPNRPFTGPVAMHGNILAVGSSQRDASTGEHRVAVFLYERASTTATWQYIRKLTDFRVSTDRGFGFLAIDATVNSVAVSARDYASVFEKTANGWVERPLPDIGVYNYPSDIAISGSTALVGGLQNAFVTGFTFQKGTTGAWSFERELQADFQPYGDNDYLGETLDLDGNYAGLVSPGVQIEEADPSHLFVFRRNDAGQWSPPVMLQDPASPLSPGSEAPVSMLALSATRGIAAFKTSALGVSVFTETSPGTWSTLHRARAMDALMNPIQFEPPQRLELARYQDRAALAFGAYTDEDRGEDSGSVGLFAPSSVLGPWRHLVKFLASDARSGLQLGSATAFHGDTVAAIGGNSVYLFRLPTSITQPQIFQDDFEDGESVGWLTTSATWSVPTSRGSRVYRQGSTSGEYVTTRSGINWRNVAIEADIRPTAFNGNDRWVSLMTRYVDDQNYYYVALRNTNVLRLAKRVGSTFTTLGSISLPVTVNRSYRVRLEAVGTWIRAYVDGELRLQARDSTHARGGVGMKTAFAQAEFDNVVVTPNPRTTLLADAFVDSISHWDLESAANWQRVDVGTNGVLRQTSPTLVARAVAGLAYQSETPELANHTVETRVRALNFGTTGALFGVMARYKDIDNYLSAVLTRNGTILLRQQSNGTTRTLDSATTSVATNRWYSLRLEAVGDRARVYLNDVLVLESRDATLDSSNTRGRFGLLTVGTVAEFDDFVANEP